jgi:hypothetical protein
MLETKVNINNKLTEEHTINQIFTRLPFIFNIIQHLHEQNDSEMEPDLHKRYYFMNHYKNTHFVLQRIMS